ncbi:hypothetical protein Tco_1480665 [Tanacetum coccineum]
MATSTQALIAEFASAPTPPSPPPSPLSPYLTYADAPLGYRAAMIQLRATSPPPVPSPPLLLPSADSSESRVMTVVEEVNKRVSDLGTTQRQDAHELHMRNEDAQDDRALLRAQISLLTRESTDLEASISTLEAQVRTLQTQHDRMEWRRQQACDMMTSAFGRIHALEARDRAHTGDAKP